MKTIKQIVIGCLLVVGIVFCYNLWMEYCLDDSNPNNYATIGDIPAPEGYIRIDGDDPKYSDFLRSLPLKPKGAVVKYYRGGMADLQELNYAVVDLPLLSNAEQCADVCMRLRAEYLYQSGRMADIHFLDVQGNDLTYCGKESREAFEKYLRKVFDRANTYSLYKEMATRNIANIQPGDVFVYPAPDSNSYGHAVMVADVAEDPETDRKAVILVEGIIPARSIHVMQNLDDTSNSPWFFISEESDKQSYTIFKFDNTNLKYFPSK